MNKFEYQLPSGDKYVVTAPAGATREEADLIFYSQVAAGSLVGYESGQTLSAVTLTPVTNELSRETRGTAGVPGTITGVYANKKNILKNIYNTAVNNTNAQIPVAPFDNTCGAIDASATSLSNQRPLSPLDGALIESVYGDSIAGTNSFNGYYSPSETEYATSVLAKYPAINAMANLADAPIESPVNQADIILAKGSSFGATPIGILSSFDVQTMMAQAAALVNQPYYQISNTKGLGKYGLSCYQLEKTGYVKPGISGRYIETNLSDFVSVMNTPSIWTGKEGVRTLDDLLSDETLQDSIFNQLMQQGYSGLQASGVIEPPPQDDLAVDTGWLYTDSGLQPISDSTVFASDEVGTLGAGTLNLVPSSAYDTLESGALAETSTCSITQPSYNYNVLRSQVVSELTKNTAALVMNSAKFGAELTALWAGSGTTSTMESVIKSAVDSTNNRNHLLNGLAGVSSYQNSFSSVNPLNTIIATSLSSGFASYARTGYSSPNFTGAAGGTTLPTAPYFGTGSAVTGFMIPTYAGSVNGTDVAQNYQGVPGGSGIAPNVNDQLLIPVTQLTSNMNIYGKAAQYAVNYVNPTAPQSTLLIYGSQNIMPNGATYGPIPLASGPAGTTLINNLLGSGSLVSGQGGSFINAGSAYNPMGVGSFTSGIGGSLLNAGTTFNPYISNGRQLAQLNTVINQLGGGSFANLGTFGVTSALALASQYGSLGNLVGGLNRFGNLFGGGNGFMGGYGQAGGFSGTIRRDTLDVACLRILGNPKIPQPIYGYPSQSFLGIFRNIVAAAQRLRGASSGTDAFGATAQNIFYRG